MAQYGGAVGVAHAPVVSDGDDAWLAVRDSDGNAFLTVRATSLRSAGGYSTLPPYESDSYGYNEFEVEARVNGSTVSFPAGEIKTSHEVFDPDLGMAVRQKCGHTFEMAWRLGTLSGSDHLADGALRFVLDGVEVINETGLALGRVDNAAWETVTIWPDGAIRAVYVRDTDATVSDFAIAEEEEPFSDFLAIDTAEDSRMLYSANYTSATDADVFASSGGFWTKSGTVTLEDGFITSLTGSISHEFEPVTLGIRAVAIFGEHVTVKGATRAFVMGLDGESHVCTRSNTLTVYGDAEITGTLKVAGEDVVSDLSAQLDAVDE